MKKAFLTPVLALLLYPLFSQSIERQLIGSAGGNTSGEIISLDWTMGESFNTFTQNGLVNMKEGFLQPNIWIADFEPEIIFNIDKQGKEFSAFISPNPFASQFTFHLFEPQDQHLKLWLLDYSGKKIMSKTLEAGSQSIEWNLDSYPSGLYLLQALTDQVKLAQVFKIVKR